MTLPDHERCLIHRGYKLGCEQFESLIARSGQRCEICGAQGTAGLSAGKLHIDHDHSAPRWAVRGLLCTNCNVVLTSKAVDARAPWAADYLDNSWWVRECERVGVPTTIAPEPDYGSAIRDQWNVLWLREGDGKWRPQGNRRPGISWTTWEWLYDQRGPHNMAPLDLYALEEDGRSLFWDHLTWEAERAALQALLAEVSGKDVPLYAVRAHGRLLSAYMDEPMTCNTRRH